MPDPTERLKAALEGRYSIERELGEGGMATVYLAHDVRHNRKVALKVLKPELAAVIGGERFLVEIQTTANLQHPHILPLFDSGEEDGFLYYVMPFVEGESLREKLDRERQLGVEDSLHIAKAVASALQYAHERDVIHRDIKPENILIHAGEPVVADFGIALALSAAGGGRMTETGLSLGTPHYMSPEQATADRDLSARSDVYALACVLYEMLAGDPPHTGPTAQSILVRILTESPRPVTEVRASVPPHVDAALSKALEKLPADRFDSAEAFATTLDDEGFTYIRRTKTDPVMDTAPVVVTTPDGAIGRRAFTAVAGVAALAVGVAAWSWLTPPPPLQPTRAVMDLGDIALGLHNEVLVSPDGSRFAVAATWDGQRALYWRGAAAEGFRPIPGTEVDVRFVSFSPDNEWLAYTDGSSLLKVAISGGAPRPVVQSGDFTPGDNHWGDDGNIVFINRGQSGVYRVPDTGGEPELLLEASGPVRNPRLLPGGEAVIFTNTSVSSTFLFDLEADSVRELIPGGIDASYVETGHLLYADVAGSLWAVEFNVGRGEVVGDAVPVLDGLSVIRGYWARYSVARNGTLVYGVGGGAGGVGVGRRILLVDMQNNLEEPPLDPRFFFDHRWSPDGRSVVYSSVEAGDADPDIFTYNVELGTTPRPLTFEGVNLSPVWSPDGTRVAFRSQRDGTDGDDLFVKNVIENSPPERLLALPGGQSPTHWPSDDTLVFEHGSGPPDLWMLDMSGDSVVATEYLPSEDALFEMRVSPTGDLAAYGSMESGTPEIYVRSFPEPGARELVSQGGGQNPFWSPDGDTIYYWTLGQDGSVVTLMAARVQRGPPFVVTATDSVLSGPYRPDDWALHPDGDRFVVTQDLTSNDGTATNTERHLIVTNWFEELKERLGGN